MNPSEQAYREWLSGRATENYTPSHLFMAGFTAGQAKGREEGMREAAKLCGELKLTVVDFKAGDRLQSVILSAIERKQL